MSITGSNIDIQQNDVNINANDVVNDDGSDVLLLLATTAATICNKAGYIILLLYF